MKLSQLSHLLSIVLLCGPLLLIVWKKQERVLKRYELSLLVAILVSMPIAMGEYFAFKWKAWAYNPNEVLHLRIGGQIESFVLLIGVMWLVGSVTLIYALKIDKRNRQKTKSKLKLWP